MNGSADIAPLTVAVTGATGFLGRHTVAALAAAGCRLRLLARREPLALLELTKGKTFPFAGTSVLIMVGVGLETVKQIESQLMLRNYEGFLK